METKLEQIAVKAVNQLPKSVVREIRTLRSVGAGGGRLPPATRWALSNERPYREHFSFEVSAACVGLVSSPPERPCENTVDRDAPLSELDSDATDFLDRPADQERCLVGRRGDVFLSAGSALAR